MAKKQTVTKHGGTGLGKPLIVASWRDLGREGPGRHKADSPWTRQGIYIQSSQKVSEATKESGPGLSLERRKRKENPNQKRRHRFLPDGYKLCMLCVRTREGHDKLLSELGSRRKADVHVTLT